MNKTEEARTIAYNLAEKSLADNLEISDAVNDYLKFHPRQAARFAAAELRDLAYDIMTEFTLED